MDKMDSCSSTQKTNILQIMHLEDVYNHHHKNTFDELYDELSNYHIKTKVTLETKK